MRPTILFTVSMLAEITFCLHIPNNPSSTIPIAATSSYLRRDHDHDTGAVGKTTSSPKILPVETSEYPPPCHIITSLSKRGPAPASFLFSMGKERSYYELHGEKATDHLYDVKDGTVVGSEIVEKKGDELIKQMWRSVGAPRKIA